MNNKDITFHLGDCIDVLKTIPDNSIDLIFADPPYNLQLKNELIRPNKTKVEAVNDVWDKFSSFTEYDVFTEKWLSECQRVLKHTGTLWVIGSYHNIFRVGKILQDIGFWILNDVCWVKTNPMPNFLGTRFTNAHETLIWAKKNEKAKGYTFHYKDLKAQNNGYQMRSDWFLDDVNTPVIFTEGLCIGKERIRNTDGTKAHNTQKPEKLIERIILGCSNEGDTVLDPFCGSGTTASVCYKNNRKCITIDKESVYIDIAKERIKRIHNDNQQNTIQYNK